MRSDDQPIPEEAVGFNFHFQIANGAGRKACSVRVQAHNFHDARGFFHQNWPTIELMARESLTSAAEGRRSASRCHPRSHIDPDAPTIEVVPSITERLDGAPEPPQRCRTECGLRR